MLKTFLSACVCIAALTSPVKADPLAILDDRGEVVTVKEPAKKIASVSLFGADLASVLGLEVVATSYLSKDSLPPFLADDLKNAAQLGSRSAPNMEVLAKAKPDLIVAIRRYTEGFADEYEAIAPYLALHTESYADSNSAIVMASHLMGVKEKGQALNSQFEEDIYNFEEKIPEGPRKSYLFLWGSGEAPWAYYDDYHTVAILNSLGMTNPIGSNPTPHDRNNFAYQMNLEEMLEIDPEYIIVFDRGPDEPFLTNPIWDELKAVKNKKVFFVGDHWMASHGPLARQNVLHEAAHMIYPDLFPKKTHADIKKHVLSAVK
ncbi:ABC transporter substrate-binding protein [Kiloniella litopenaei]|uniref:ABC transporter substrate-binding protein n=1 Tax=Kiloniella litopenaei TaxID=1549748 RepID=UPI003BAD6059